MFSCFARWHVDSYVSSQREDIRKLIFLLLITGERKQTAICNGLYFMHSFWCCSEIKRGIKRAEIKEVARRQVGTSTRCCLSWWHLTAAAGHGWLGSMWSSASCGTILLQQHVALLTHGNACVKDPVVSGSKGERFSSLLSIKNSSRSEDMLWRVLSMFSWKKSRTGLLKKKKKKGCLMLCP